jgi:hypothetical protein
MPQPSADWLEPSSNGYPARLLQRESLRHRAQLAANVRTLTDAPPNQHLTSVYPLADSPEAAGAFRNRRLGKGDG